MDERDEAFLAENPGATAYLYGGFLSADERWAVGKSLRDGVPRESHGGWNAPENRPDPIDCLIKSAEGRLPYFIPIRFGRMVQSPFSFYRGAAALMAADLASTPQSGLRVQACGDAHLMNFGGFVAADGNIIFDIHDYDETLPAPWEWDVKRLAASIVIAAHHLGFSDSEAVEATTGTVRSYRDRMAHYNTMRALDVWHDYIDLDDYTAEAPSHGEVGAQWVERRIEHAEKRATPELVFPKLADNHGSLSLIKDQPPLIFHPTEEQAPGLKSGYTEQIARYRESLPEHVRVLFDRYHLRDLAFKAVGVGSVGTHCAIALLMAADDDPIFLQIKDARVSILEPYAGKSLHKNSGERVVAGQRLMQSASDIFLGWGRDARGRDHYIRQLRDTKLGPIMESWDFTALRTYGRLCAWALARAHARSGDATAIAGYMGFNSTFDDAIGLFAVEYADQNQRDYRAFVDAVRDGRIDVIMDE